MKPFLRKTLKYFAVVGWLVTIASAVCLAGVYIFGYIKNFRLTVKKVIGVIRVLMEL